MRLFCVPFPAAPWGNFSLCPSPLGYATVSTASGSLRLTVSASWAVSGGQWRRDVIGTVSQLTREQSAPGGAMPPSSQSQSHTRHADDLITPTSTTQYHYQVCGDVTTCSRRMFSFCDVAVTRWSSRVLSRCRHYIDPCFGIDHCTLHQYIAVASFLVTKCAASSKSPSDAVVWPRAPRLPLLHARRHASPNRPH